MNVLLLGRKNIIVTDVREQADIGEDIKLFTGTSLADVENYISKEDINTVIMGAGIDLDTRLKIIKYIYNNSTSVTVHMKDWDSGPAGMLPFVRSILSN